MSWLDEFLELIYPLDGSRVFVEAAYSLKNGNLPASIYKYRGVNDNSLRNLREDTIWLADPRSFNDPYDCAAFVDFDRMANEMWRVLPEPLASQLRPHFNLNEWEGFERGLRESDDPQGYVIAALMKSEPQEKVDLVKAALSDVFRHITGEMGEKSADAFKDGFKLCSFSDRVDSTLMWAHYADYHAGFCVEYSMRGVSPDDYLARFLYPVIYSEHPFDATDNALNVGTSRFNNLYLNRAGLIKSKDWAYEQEWRLIFSNGVMKSSQAYKMPKPRMVYLGSHIKERQQASVLEICREKGIGVMKMKHSRATFTMQPLSVEEVDRRLLPNKPSQ